MKNNTHIKIHASIVEDGAFTQIEDIANSPVSKGLISIMPDVHKGAGCVIGLTMKLYDKVIPNIIGVDIGCGVLAYNLGNIDIDFEAFDEYVRKNIPLGFKKRNEKEANEIYSKLNRENSAFLSDLIYVDANIIYKNDVANQIGTLGGGNHFIEVAEDDIGNKWLLIHTGSRNFGLAVANYYQKKAEKLCSAMGVDVKKGLEFLPLEFGGNDYLNDMKVMQKFAKMNRRVILELVLKFFHMEINDENIVESVHNYIDEHNMIRKGAISAHKNEKVIIPFNMAEGSIIGIGKGNIDYNNSAPHGSGRIHGRQEMFRKLESGEYTMNDFKESMNGVYSTSICKKTFDESKFAYKQFSDVEKHLKETVDIKYRLKPIYNLKSD